MSLVFSRKMQVSVTCAVQTWCSFFLLKSSRSSSENWGEDDKVKRVGSKLSTSQWGGLGLDGQAGMTIPTDQGRMLQVAREG